MSLTAPKAPLVLLLALASCSSSESFSGAALRAQSAMSRPALRPAAPAFRRPAAARQPRAGLLTAAAGGIPADDGGSPASSARPLTAWITAHRSSLLLVALIAHKCATDGLTRWTRVQGAYSGSTVAIMSEVVKFPLIALAIGTLGGGYQNVLPVLRDTVRSKPFSNAWIGLCYTFNNLLYFDALTALSATAYQVLSQSKTLFTAGLMYVVQGKKLLPRQLLAIAMLIGGALLVQLQELARLGGGAAAGAAAGAAGLAAASRSAVWWGVALTLFSSFISALPNVAYEKVLKTEGENQWVNNLQVTLWITIWVSAAAAARPALGLLRGLASGELLRRLTSSASSASCSPAGALASAAAAPGALLSSVRASFAGFTAPVWGVVMLKALNGILIPATFKYADNIVYAYARPSSIVVTTLGAALLARQLPSASLMLGVATVVGSINLYSSKPKERTE